MLHNATHIIRGSRVAYPEQVSQGGPHYSHATYPSKPA
jgi:hypothetical protein